MKTGPQEEFLWGNEKWKSMKELKPCAQHSQVTLGLTSETQLTSFKLQVSRQPHFQL